MCFFFLLELVKGRKGRCFHDAGGKNMKVAKKKSLTLTVAFGSFVDPGFEVGLAPLVELGL